jgi:DNA-binding response OmpR family regulator
MERLLGATASELQGLQRNLAGALSQEEQAALAEEVQRVASRVRSEAALREGPALQEWLQAAEALTDALRAPQAVPMETVQGFTAVVARAEKAARTLPPPGPQLAGELHLLNGKVRGFASTQGWPRRVEALRELLTPLAQRGAPYRDLLADSGVNRLLTGFSEGLRAVQASAPEANAPADLRNLCEAHREAVDTLTNWAAAPVAAGEKPAYRQVIVVEDDVGWRERMIVPLLRAEFPDLTVVTAPDYPSARRLIQQADQPSIVLVDLGLPPAVEERLGLKLLEEFAMARPQDRFIVLTAAEDYEDVARQAIMAGVQPHDYLLKDPAHWEEEVVTRIYAALQPRSRTHRIEVFQCTARLIRIDGVEVELEQKPFRLFEYLARNSRQKCPVDMIVEGLMADDVLEKRKGASQWIADRVYDIRQAIGQAFQAVQRPIDPSEVIKTESVRESLAGETLYYLTSRAILHETFESISDAPPRLPILVVEDEPRTSKQIVAALTAKGLPCETAMSVEEARQKIDELLPQIVTLDLQLPRAPGGTAEEPLGLEVLHYLRQRVAESRVAVFTSIEWRDAVRLNLLRAGVHVQDYLSKNWEHAMERLIQSVWRLTQELERGSTFAGAEGPLALHHVHLDASQPGCVWVDDLPIDLPDSLYGILQTLARARNLPVDRGILVDRLWPVDLPEDKFPEDPDGALNTYLARLRREIRQQTQGRVEPREMIREKDGAYWLQAIVS